jgi:hypothetical protein
MNLAEERGIARDVAWKSRQILKERHPRWSMLGGNGGYIGWKACRRVAGPQERYVRRGPPFLRPIDDIVHGQHASFQF